MEIIKDARHSCMLFRRAAESVNRITGVIGHQRIVSPKPSDRATARVISWYA